MDPMTLAFALTHQQLKDSAVRDSVCNHIQKGDAMITSFWEDAMSNPTKDVDAISEEST